MIRQPIITVMGHVDHGKTTLLDKIRSSAIASKEAGRITQHIGASEVPLSVINEICKDIPNFSSSNMKIPGLLFIDTPGHEAFTNLRRRGGSIADMAIVVVDITQGFQPQTIEAINILKEYKTPFVVAANKIDLLTGWMSNKTRSFQVSYGKQSKTVQDLLDNKLYELVGRFGELGFNSELYSRVSNFQNELAIVPVSAKTGEGIAELLMVVSGLSQRFLELKLNIEVNGPAKGSILEKKEIKGLGTTLDVIIYDGTLHINDQIAFADSNNEVNTTKVKALLKPKPMHEIGASASKFYYVDSVSAASGIKISAVGIEDAMPGSPIIAVTGNDDYKNIIKSEMADIFKTDNAGIILKADSIGSLEAISKLMSSENFRISKKGIGNVNKRDIMDAFSMYGTDPLYAVIIAFNVSIDNDAEEEAKTSGVKIISENVIYKLIDSYKEFVNLRTTAKKKEAEDRITFPSKIEVIAGDCFRVSHPAIFGIKVETGRIKPGFIMINDSGIVVGKIKGIQNEKQPLQEAKRGDEIAMSMDEPTYGRQIQDNQILYTRVTKEMQFLLQNEFSYLLNDDDKKTLEEIIRIMNKNSTNR
ncbi:translation initiation factor aIF2/5B [Candidatus Mancarchaeum acidiphilum]|uniref:Probable translation initiation factor IF-2 n=1 Tax=Candidatus Mancarchaeum acidiphilum TaxID=1920749 RepID=A0A218NM67_9ARCH|nr:translation initiation factor IF-2 [Candidatus Mancarchaeum acidiphilum]ASI13556.1 translation initiation factor aIF2/5B [Candidatus Mancarchaeum acidiphilum]